MSTDGNQQEQQAADVQTTETAASLLDAAIQATPRTKKDRAKEMIGALIEEVTRGAAKVDATVTRTIDGAVTAIDQVVSEQLAKIMHDPKFQKLEGSWRGLHYLVKNSETGDQMKIRMLNCGKRDLLKDLERAKDFDQSEIHQKMYADEYDTPGGVPYGALIGDYEFENHPDDISLLTKMAGSCALSFTPFLTAPSPGLFDLDHWEQLKDVPDVARLFEGKKHIGWRSFRDSEDSRFITMCMPRTLARLPYGKGTKPIDEFGFEEVNLGAEGEAIEVPHDKYCWMNTAYAMGTRLTAAFAKYGWCTAIRGYENGGLVEELPVHVFKSMEGDDEVKCPTEISIPDSRENELSQQGFLPLCHYKDTDYSVFFGGQTTQKPKKYDRPEATANAAISARLPYMMATSRFAHYLKCIARDKIGAFMERDDCEKWLDRWIHNYVSADENPSQEVRASRPLADAQVEVKEVPGQPGFYSAVVHLRPWLQLEALTASLRMVAKIPRKKG